jgi:hypothetical protein
LTRYKRIKAKLGKAAPDLLENLSYRPNQFKLVGLIGKYPKIDVIPTVLSGEGTETGKSLDTFGKLATSFNIVTPVLKFFFFRLQFSTNLCASLLFHPGSSIHPRSYAGQAMIASLILTRPLWQPQITVARQPQFGIFVQGNGTVTFDPAANRIFVRFKDDGNITRGSTSVAVRTQ